MYKVIRPSKDTYITDRVIKGTRVTGSNVGGAGTLDLFKLYGITTSGSSPNVELSRLLIKFDLEPLTDLFNAGKIDPGHSSFSCTLKLFDVYGGQPTPSNFTLAAYPLSRSFDEGIGRDVVFYSDRDVCNFMSSSRAQGSWVLSGCAQGGGPTQTVDYITGSGAITFKTTQTFTTGEEDLAIDVTSAVSATLAGIIPDQGFRISFDTSHEQDAYTYFVKRFASRTAYNEDVRPQLIVKFDDSIQDDSLNLTFDNNKTLFLYNYANDSLANITSGSSLTQITGSNSLILKLSTEISGGTYELVFTGSQHVVGVNSVTGIYSASVLLPSTNATLAAKLAVSGSVKFKPIWGSLDGTVAYLTGSTVTARPATRTSVFGQRNMIVSVRNVSDTYEETSKATLRVHIFDNRSPDIVVRRLPYENVGTVVRDVHYQIRDSVTDKVYIPFDTVNNSTRVSSDSTGMYFTLDVANLLAGRSYVIDIMIVTSDDRTTYRSASPIFRVIKTQ